jgi:GNAT superfamily N-acetyltransferase
MRPDDLAIVAAIADRVHLDHPEDPAVFADRLALFPAGCLVVEADCGALGYCISHPGIVGQPPPLDTVLGRIDGADCLYIHDLCLLPEARGRGLAAAIARLLEEVARAHGFGCIALTAVNDSDGFWQSQGFEAHPCSKLASYGAASYRLKRLG